MIPRGMGICHAELALSYKRTRVSLTFFCLPFSSSFLPWSVEKDFFWSSFIYLQMDPPKRKPNAMKPLSRISSTREDFLTEGRHHTQPEFLRLSSVLMASPRKLLLPKKSYLPIKTEFIHPTSPPFTFVTPLPQKPQSPIFSVTQDALKAPIIWLLLESHFMGLQCACSSLRWFLSC